MQQTNMDFSLLKLINMGIFHPALHPGISCHLIEYVKSADYIYTLYTLLTRHVFVVNTKKTRNAVSTPILLINAALLISE